MKKKLQVVIATHSPSLISGLPNSAIKMFNTNQAGQFFVQEGVSYQEAFFCIEDKIETQKTVFCEDVFAKKIIDKTLVRMGKESFIDVVYTHGGADTMKKHHLTTYALNDELLNQVFFIFDGDQDNDYTFDEMTIPYSDEKEQEIKLKECMKMAFGIELDAYPDGSKNGGRKDQVVEDYLKYLKYYNTNVFFLPNKKIPEEIVLACNYVKNNYEDFLTKYEQITAFNAKEIIMEITKSDHGDGTYYEETADKLAFKWSQEASDEIMQLQKILLEIIQR